MADSDSRGVTRLSALTFCIALLVFAFLLFATPEAVGMGLVIVALVSATVAMFLV